MYLNPTRNKKQKKLKLSLFSFTIIVIFLYPILPQYIYIVGGINVVNGLLAAFYFIYILWGGKLTRISVRDNIFFYWLFFVFMTFNYFVGAGVLKATTYIMSFVLFPWIIISVVNSEERFLKAIDIVILAGVVIGLLGIVESALGYNFIQPFGKGDTEFFHEFRYGLLRIMTTFGQPISYGIFQIFIITLINYRKSSASHKKILMICYIISALNIILSVSRSPIIAYILIQMILSYRKSNRKFLNRLCFISIGIMSFLIIATAVGFKIPMIDDLAATLGQISSGETDHSSTTVGVGNRFELWEWVGSSMGDNWLLGNGLTTEFAYKVHPWQIKTSIENQYLYVLFHNGIIGVTILILSYVSILGYSFKRRKVYIDKAKERLSFNSIVFTMMATYYIVELGTQESDITRIYTVFIALLIAYNRIARTKQGQERKKMCEQL